MQPKLLIVGGSGFIGGRLVQAAHHHGYSVSYTCASRLVSLPGHSLHTDFVAGDTAELVSYIARIRPDAVVYCASPSPRASADVHHCVSVDGVYHTLQELRTVRPDARFIYISTNAVFGTPESRMETSPPYPERRRDELRVYACSKFEGERLVLQEWADSLVIRTATVGGRKADGSWSRRLGATIEEIRSGGIIRRFDDRFISPTLVDDLVAAILEVLEPAWSYRGILHVAGAERITDYDYTRRLAWYLGHDPACIEPEHMQDVSAVQGSPHDTTLDTALAARLLQVRLRGVKEQLQFLFSRSGL